MTRPPRKDREAAYTLVEAAAAIAAISLVALVGFYAIAGAQKAFRRLEHETHSASSLLILEKALRRDLGRIAYPLWAVPELGTASTDRLDLPYYNGDAGQHLVLECSGDRLFIQTPDGRMSYGPFQDLGLSPLLSSDGRAIGVGLALSAGGTRVELSAVFSSLPMTGGLK